MVIMKILDFEILMETYIKRPVIRRNKSLEYARLYSEGNYDRYMYTLTHKYNIFAVHQITLFLNESSKFCGEMLF